ncbi:hypothetical protein EVAR_89753_1 [Eumeta japonica]|uniref:Uncharacterized protein n=1 Tax=Eumeta variegata TaxID=151549 RepID=A0A4C1SMN7_EUMVA|nr:hypothetical protein EVAR_89753_1 [Eumeta japonica]
MEWTGSVTGIGIENEAGTKIENDTRGENERRIKSMIEIGIENETGTEIENDTRGENKCGIKSVTGIGIENENIMLSSIDTKEKKSFQVYADVNGLF